MICNGRNIPQSLLISGHTMLFIIFLSMAKNNNPDYRFNKLDIFLSFGGSICLETTTVKSEKTK